MQADRTGFSCPVSSALSSALSIFLYFVFLFNDHSTDFTCIFLFECYNVKSVYDTPYREALSGKEKNFFLHDRPALFLYIDRCLTCISEKNIITIF